MIGSGLLDWLLDSDPALRWQVQRDLADEPEDVWRGTRALVARQGFGAALLAKQDPDGQWAGGAFFPPDVTEADFDHGGQPWNTTTWSLTSLREWGVDASALADTAERLAANCRWEFENLPYWGGETDVCINAFTLANGAWLGADVSELAQFFLDHEMAEGGWNCEWVEGSRRASFHSTLNAVRGLLEHERYTGGSDALRAVRRRGEEYLLQRELLRRRSDGEIVGPWVDHFGYPFRAEYSALNALDYLRAASLFDGTAPDRRAAPAVELIRSKQGDDGRWLQERARHGRVWFELDVNDGQPSKWLTFHALRVLRWWDDVA